MADFAMLAKCQKASGTKASTKNLLSDVNTAKKLLADLDKAATKVQAAHRGKLARNARAPWTATRSGQRRAAGCPRAAVTRTRVPCTRATGGGLRLRLVPAHAAAMARA